jgi:fibro-slime domain-containing protein
MNTATRKHFVSSGIGIGFCAAIGAIASITVPSDQSSVTQAAVTQTPPQTLSLVGLVRDFKERTVTNGHPDFEINPDKGFGLYCGNIGTMIGADRKPVYTGNGHFIKSQWTDKFNRPICYNIFNTHPAQGDHAGNEGAASHGGITSQASMNMWYNDVLGTNMSRLISLTLQRQSDGSYVFDDKLDPTYAALGGFFPIENILFGNPGGSPDRNFHFTFELHTQFTYLAAGNQMFKFIGDDDVFVFINDKLVIDLGGVHAAMEQYVDLNRLGLQDGHTYWLDFFYAERHRTQANCRIQTNLQLTNTQPAAITAQFD